MNNEGLQTQTDQEYIAQFKTKVLRKAVEFATIEIDTADTREIKDWVDVVTKLNSFEITQNENKVHILLEKVGAKFQDDL